MDLLVLAVRLLVGGLFLAAGLAKLLAGQAFVLRVVEGYNVLPKPAVEVWARMLPAIELIVGAILVAGLWSRPAASAAALLLAAITAASASVLLRRRKADCGCFGSRFSKQVSWTVVARNLVLMTALGAVVLEGGGLVSLDALPSIRMWATLAVAATACAVTISFGRTRSREARV